MPRDRIVRQVICSAAASGAAGGAAQQRRYLLRCRDGAVPCSSGHVLRRAEIMDMSFGIQAKSLEYLAKTRGTLENKVYAVPAEIDKAVATIKLAAESVQIDVLTPEQTAYLNQIE